MNHYEMLYLVGGNYTEEELKPIRDSALAMIKKANGTVSFDENFGKKKLAYPIKHNHQGYYVIAEFSAEPEELKELDRQFRLSNEILRHIIVTRDPSKQTTLKMDEVMKKDDELMFGKPVKKDFRTAAPIVTEKVREEKIVESIPDAE